MRPPGPLLLLLAAAATSAGDDCPHICTCKWKQGKQTAECRQKNLHTLPAKIPPVMQVLDLSLNLIQRLPRRAFAKEGLTNLQRIFLRRCELVQIDNDALLELTNLVELDLSENRLRSIPSLIFRHTPELRELLLRKNSIQVIPVDAFDHLASLRTLDLSHCYISSIAARAFEPLRLLEKLKLAFNRLTELRPRLVDSLSNLHELTVHNNPWNCDCRLRKLRKWLVEKNVPYEVSPVCAKPKRIENRTFDEMGEQEFACIPEILPNVSDIVRGAAGGNATAWCPVGGLPTPQVTWFVRDVVVHNESLLGDKGPRVFIINIAGRERGSLLLLAGVRVEDSGTTVRCDATNAAGTASASFQLLVTPGSSLAFTTDKIVAVSSVTALVVFVIVVVVTLLARRRRASSAVPIKTVTVTVNGATETRLTNLPYTPSAFVGGSVVYTKDNPNLLCEGDQSSEGEAAECCTTDEESQHSMCSAGPRLGGHSRSLDGDKATLGCPFDAVWEPERVQAMLDSAAPENVMHSSLHEPLAPSCNAMVQQRLLSSSQRHLNHRLSYLPDFAPDYSAMYSFSQVGPGQTFPTAIPHYGTIPRSVKVRSCAPEVIPGDGTPPMNHQTRAWNYGSGNVTLSSQERRGSGTLLFSAPAPTSTSACLPPQPLHGHGNKLSRITARDSPDEGYQEGADV